jgi:N-acetylglucosamine-6-phosphate deacetylase
VPSLIGRVLSDGVEWPLARVEIEHGHVVAFGPPGSTGGVDVAVEDGWILPGLVDLQVNGAGGVDLTSADRPEEAVSEVARILVRHGVTAFCPTIVTAPPEVVMARLPALGPRAHPGGATSLGAHVEGPFISPRSPGVHDPGAIRAPATDEIERWLAAGRPAIVTLAPEVPGALEAIGQLRAAGVVVSLGHSAASAAEGRAGLAAGATMGTHLFNAMPPLHHRSPGLIGALINSPATLGLLADGVHVDALAVELAIRAAGVERIALVSDAIAAAGLPAGAGTAAPPGPVRLGDQTVYSDGVAVRRADGTLAGSAAMLDHGLRNARAWCPWLSRAQVARMATETPARALGRRVRVDLDEPADLVVLDRDWNVAATLIGGEIVYRR